MNLNRGLPVGSGVVADLADLEGDPPVATTSPASRKAVSVDLAGGKANQDAPAVRLLIRSQRPWIPITMAPSKRVNLQRPQTL